MFDTYNDYRDHRVTLVLNQLEKIMATMQQLETDLRDVKTHIQKIGTETTATLAKVTELQNALANVVTTPEVDAAMAALKAQVQAVDDLCPDPTP